MSSIELSSYDCILLKEVVGMTVRTGLMKLWARQLMTRVKALSRAWAVPSIILSAARIAKKAQQESAQMTPLWPPLPGLREGKKSALQEERKRKGKRNKL
ncbi:unnamed protein product [Cuscuta europaea]|uniref:Uncharacterized protein n=1 Tax=Cuscuta europaea TaxID=41803 RepID=A0A9P1E9M3_CUSEU|nr:unnamed protein product [Cuscuta europaea]